MSITCLYFLVNRYIVFNNVFIKVLNDYFQTLFKIQFENPPKKLKKIRRMFAMQDSEPFREPVSEIDFPDYSRFITTPMDLSSIQG